MENPEQKTDKPERPAKKVIYPDIPLKTANGLVIACCVLFVLMIVVFMLLR